LQGQDLNLRPLGYEPAKLNFENGRGVFLLVMLLQNRNVRKKNG
jgi:hypothetical protein